MSMNRKILALLLVGTGLGGIIQAAIAEDIGIAISVDGQQLVGDRHLATPQVNGGGSVEAADIQIKFDGLDVKPMLNVSTVDVRRSYETGDTITFQATTNYAGWLSSGEVRVFEADESGVFSGAPLHVISLDGQGRGAWTIPDSGGSDLAYVLRVYDEQGRFDETRPLTLRRSTDLLEKHDTSPADEAVAVGAAEDRTAKRNIPVYGGAVTVIGQNVPQGYNALVMGQSVPVDGAGAFVVQQILPPGDHDVMVTLGRDKKDAFNFTREVNIPDSEWFYVGLAEATVGKRWGDGKMVDANPDEFGGVYTKGRAAFYLKGKIKGRYLLTASADTGEDKLSNIFKGLDSKNASHVLRRIDPDAYYPVYGDDSTIVDDAPTNGKFYVRLARGDSHVLWGNFKASVTGNELLRNERSLYGAQGVYKSEETTKYGDRSVSMEAYVSQPGTLPQRDQFRGTGGSAYFLSRQDITRASETVTVETRDEVTGAITSRRQLVNGIDYTINYSQGLILLSKPLPSTVGGDGVVKDTALGSDPVVLIIQYEYTPALDEVDGYSTGGRAQAWLGDHVRVGVTGMRETTGNATVESHQDMLGADAVLRATEHTFVSAEYARSKGPGFGRATSIDGGLSSLLLGTDGLEGVTGEAWTIKGQADISEIVGGPVKGKIGAYYSEKEKGFSSLDHDVNSDQRSFGASFDVDVNETFRVLLQADDFKEKSGKHTTKAKAQADIDLNEQWLLSIGATLGDYANPAAKPADVGERIDVGGKLAYKYSDDASYYVFGQATAVRDGTIARNDRYGFGLKQQLAEKVSADLEVSHGTSGFGGIAGLSYEPTADDRYYLDYRLDAGRDLGGLPLHGNDLGNIVAGAKTKYSDTVSAYAENNYDMFGVRRALTNIYGVNYAPLPDWQIDGAVEVGVVKDDLHGDIDRKAASFGVSYTSGEELSARLRAEFRDDNGDDPLLDRRSYLFRTSLSMKTSADWRLLAELNAVISDSDQSSLLDGDYVEASFGYAYRPIQNDRLNGIFKYTMFYDLPGPDQRNAADATLRPRQRSHIFSVDGVYELNQYLDIGAKYGFRIGELETARRSGVFEGSQAHLGVLRGDVHVLKDWDAVLEGRVFYSPSADITEFGALAAVYKHLTDDFKIGVGYNFGVFSDDLRDTTFDDKGVFLNVVGKF